MAPTSSPAATRVAPRRRMSWFSSSMAARYPAVGRVDRARRAGSLRSSGRLPRVPSADPAVRLEDAGRSGHGWAAAGAEVLSRHLAHPGPAWPGRGPTLLELATHRSGLPNVPAPPARRELAFALGLRRRDPWAGVDRDAFERLVRA